jgi:thiamine pyridinylase
MGRRSWPSPTAAVCFALAMALGVGLMISPNAAAARRELKVALYPFIPEFLAAADFIKRDFEAAYPHIKLDILDLRSNYYTPGDLNYIEAVDADVFEVDSTLLAEFVADEKIRELPADALLPQTELLANAYLGTQVNGKRYGAAHWICRNLLFLPKADSPTSPIRTLTDLEQFIGAGDATGRLIVDLKGKLTLGGFYLASAFDHYSDFNRVSTALESMDDALQEDIIRLLKLCPHGECRDQAAHEDTSIYGRVFARKGAKALVGYSELLYDVLAESQICGTTCLSDSDLAVSDFPLDDTGSTPITWVDSFTVNSSCAAQCLADAATFIRFMNQDSTYLQLLLPNGASSVPVVPTYLLPAKAALYSNAVLLQHAHLYPELRALVENSAVPTADQLNNKLRLLGAQLDNKLNEVSY